MVMVENVCLTITSPTIVTTFVSTGAHAAAKNFPFALSSADSTLVAP